MEVAIIRGSTKETRAAILKSAMEVFLEVGYQEASMRKIAARAGITAGAIYKHFSGKEEMFDEIFEESGRKLMEVTESRIGIDFTAMSDDELLNVLYSRVSVQIFDMLEGDMQLFHMLLKNDSGKCLEKFRSIYIERSAGFAIKYYDELYKRGIATRKLSERTVYMLSLAEFSMVCEIIADDTCQSEITSGCHVLISENDDTSYRRKENGKKENRKRLCPGNSSSSTVRKKACHGDVSGKL